VGIYPIIFTEKAIKSEIDGYKKANENPKYPIVLKIMGTIPISILFIWYTV